jgi:hypothetical protein
MANNAVPDEGIGILDSYGSLEKSRYASIGKFDIHKILPGAISTYKVPLELQVTLVNYDLALPKGDIESGEGSSLMYGFGFTKKTGSGLNVRGNVLLLTLGLRYDSGQNYNSEIFVRPGIFYGNSALNSIFDWSHNGSTAYAGATGENKFYGSGIDLLQSDLDSRQYFVMAYQLNSNGVNYHAIKKDAPTKTHKIDFDDASTYTTKEQISLDSDPDFELDESSVSMDGSFYVIRYNFRKDSGNVVDQVTNYHQSGLANIKVVRIA